MGASVVPIVGQIITSVVVSKAASTVASKIGLSDSMAGLVGIAAGGFAASQIPGGIGTTPDAATPAPVGVDLSLGAGMPTPGLGMNAPPPIAPQMPGVDLTMASAPGAQNALSMTSPTKTPGLLSQGGGSPAAPVTPPRASTSSRIIESSTTPAAETETGWWGKLFSPEKTMDMVMGAASGYAKAGMLEYEINRPYERQDELAREWEQAGTSGVGSIRRNFPTQGGQ